MASNTKVFKTRKRLKNRSMGKKRKKALAKKGTTPSQQELFGDAK